MKDNGDIDVFMIIVIIGVITVWCVAGYLFVSISIESSKNEENNIHYTKLITPIYISDDGFILDSNYNTYQIIRNQMYPSAKNFTTNKYNIINAIRTNKTVELTIQSICMPLNGCEEAVSGVEYV